MFSLHSMPDIGYAQARYSGNQEAVYDYDRNLRYSYAQMQERATRLGAFLLEVLGLKKGDRIAFCSGNSVAFIDAFFMSYRTGIVLTSYNCMMGSHVLAHLTASETPKVIFYSDKYVQAIETLRQDGAERVYIAIHGAQDSRDRFAYDDILRYESDGTAVYDPPGPEDIQMLIHTGGTTGICKAAMMSYRALFCNAVSEILAWDLTSRDCLHIFLPFFHTAGWNVLTFPLLLAGGRVIVTEEFHPSTAMEILAAERPTVCMGVETVYKMIMRHAQFEAADFSCFRFLITGAAPISRQTLEVYWEKGVNLVNAYGMTEIGPNNLSPPVCLMTPEERREKWNAVGKPMLFNNIRIVGENGEDLPDGERGELLFNGSLTFSGYWMNEEQTRATVKDGWIYTGDIAYKDGDGYYYICGRKKNMYISGGENIYPIEIEHILTGHPAVENACVIGVPDDKWGEVGKALVVLKQGCSATKQELQELVTQEGAYIKVPKYIQFLDNIPLNSVGKQDLPLIRETYGFGSE